MCLVTYGCYRCYDMQGIENRGLSGVLLGTYYIEVWPVTGMLVYSGNFFFFYLFANQCWFCTDCYLSVVTSSSSGTCTDILNLDNVSCCCNYLYFHLICLLSISLLIPFHFCSVCGLMSILGFVGFNNLLTSFDVLLYITLLLSSC